MSHTTHPDNPNPVFFDPRRLTMRDVLALGEEDRALERDRPGLLRHKGRVHWGLYGA
jgi:hypothetical protein